MVRSVENNYNFWLSGYYDDFLNARAIPDDRNVPSGTTAYSTLTSHHGNTMNGEALLNPKYRFSYPDRASLSTVLSSMTTTPLVLNDYKYTKNNGMFEWLSSDTTRNNYSTWSGKAQLQYPDGHIANRIKKFDSTTLSIGDHGFQLFCNGTNTNNVYMVPTGQYDPTFGRSVMEAHQTSDGSSGVTSTVYSDKKAGVFETVTGGEALILNQQAHLAGVWTGETLSFSHADSGAINPTNNFHPVTSPSKQPFLSIRRFETNDSSTNGPEFTEVPSIIYDGSLNSRLDDDVFHIRFASRCFSGDIDATNTLPASGSTTSFTNGALPTRIEFNIGYAAGSNTSEITTSAGLSGTPAITFNLCLGIKEDGAENLTNALFHHTYDCYGAQYLGASAQTFSNDDAWVDLDVRIDYTNQKFYVYVNGTNKTTNGISLVNTSFGGAIKVEDMHGWDATHTSFPISAAHGGSTSSGYLDKESVNYFLIDRAGLVHYLTEDLESNAWDITIGEINLQMPASGISTMDMILYDDPTDGSDGSASSNYIHHLNPLFALDTPVDWSLLMFASEEATRIDRPVWRGVIDRMTVQQNQSARELRLSAQHYISLLDRQIPLWDIGQVALDNNESGDAPYWLYDAQGLKSILRMGTTPLKLCQNNLGFETSSNYLVTNQQRMQLGSGHPIQMYNNEDTEHGPNSIENQWEGEGVLGYFKTPEDINFYNGSGFSGTVRVGVSLAHYSGYTAGGGSPTDVTVENETTSAHNFSAKELVAKKAVASSGGVSFADWFNGEQEWLMFASGGSGFTYTPESAKIIYIGKYTGEAFTDDWWNDLGNEMSDGEREEYWNEEVVSAHPHVNDNSSPYQTEMFSTDPGLKVGDYIYVNHINDNNDIALNHAASSNNPMSPLPGVLKGRKRIANIRKIRNYFRDTNEGYFTGMGAYVWCATTNTPVEPLYEGNVGSYATGSSANSHTLLATTQRISWVKCTDIAGISPQSTGGIRDKTDDRVVHARWMRDLPKSLWFQYHFGVINEMPAATDHSNTDTLAGYSAGAESPFRTGWGNNGNVLADITKGSSVIQITDDLYTALNAKGLFSGIGEIRAEGFYASDLASSHANYHLRGSNSGTQPNNYCKFMWQGLYSTGSNRYLIGCKYVDANFSATNSSKTLHGTSTDYKNNIWVIPLSISDNYKHLWLLWADMRNDGNADADGGQRVDNFGLIYPTTDEYTCTLYFADQNDPETGAADKWQELKMPSDCHILDIGGYDPIRKTTHTETINTYSGGSYSRPVLYESTLNTAATTAVEDGGSSRVRLTNITEIGMGKVSVGDWIHIHNSLKHDGTWQIQAKDDVANKLTLYAPYVQADAGNTGGVQVCLTSAATNTKYRDWETKGGAVCVVDCSPFFNLNTFANSGRAYQISGGRSDLGEFIWGGLGNPLLEDNYWEEAIAHPFNTDSTFSKHPNWHRVYSKASLLDADVAYDDTSITVQDVSVFDHTGMGKLIFEDTQTLSEGSTQNVIAWDYFKWGSKNETERTGTASTGGTTKTYDYGTNGTVTGKKFTMSGATFREWGIKPLMHIINTTDGTRHKILEIGTATAEDCMWIDNYADWDDGDDWKIPIQLGNVWITSQTLTSGTAENNWSGMEEELENMWIDAGSPYGSEKSYNIKTTDTETDFEYESITVQSTLANQYSLRTMMHIEGNVETKNSGSFYESDKLRLLWNLAVCRNWFPNTNLNCMFDINNVPITLNLTTDGTNNNLDSYGSVLSGGTRTLLNQVKEMRKRTGFGVDSSVKTTFGWLGGRDGRIDFRPYYNTGIALNRDNVQVSDFKAEANIHITHIRVYYNDGQSFVDYPKPAHSDTTRWKIIEYPEIRNSKEAISIAKQEYNARKTTNSSLIVSPNAQFYTEDGTTNNISNHLFDKGRYGYIADQCVALQGNNDDGVPGAWSWTRLGTGGCLFPGAVNAMDGNLGTTGSLKNRWGVSQTHQAFGVATDVAWANNFYWYGSHSVSNAVQIVHVPNRCPLVSEQTEEDMRIFVALKGGQTLANSSIDEATFVVFLVDYEFTGRGRVASINTGTFTASNRVSTVECKGSGFYEIEIPPSYWNNGGSAWTTVPKMTISFNAEYCRELLRSRCGNPTTSAAILTNANTITGIASGTSAGEIESNNNNSIFPLGGKVHPTMYMFLDDATRLEWYAPRVMVCRDMAYRPASYVKYTDAGLGYTNETFAISDVRYRKNPTKEMLNLNLVKDESLRSGLINAFLNTNRLEPSVIDESNNVNIPVPDGNAGTDDWSPPIYAPDGGGNFTPIGNVDTPLDDNRIISLDFSNSKKYIGWEKKILAGDMLNFGGVNFLGQQSKGRTPTAQRNLQSSEGTFMRNTAGSGVYGNNGYTFPGVGNNSDNSATSPTSFQTDVIVQRGVVGKRVIVEAKVTHAAGNVINKIAQIDTTVTCKNTSVTQSKKIPSGIKDKRLILFDGIVSDSNVIGNRLTVKLSRTAGSGSDTSNFNGVTLKGLQITQNAAVASSDSSSVDQLRPY